MRIRARQSGRLWALAAAITVVAIALAVDAAMAVSAANGAGGRAAEASAKTVKVRDNSYSKPSLTINKGATVTWAWQGTRHQHNVTVSSGPVSFHSKTKSGSFTFSHKFTKAGTYKLHCTIHPTQMKITVTVKK